MRKCVISLLFPLFAVLSLVMVTSPTLAYTKPGIPEFTVTFEAHPYYVPPVYEIDRYTGENRTVQQGYTVKNESIVVTIKNQPFTSYTEDGSLISLTHSVRVKGHYEDSWTELVHIEPQGSEYVRISYVHGQDARTEILRNVPIGGELDFQVDARVGYYTYDPNRCREYFTGETSGWSETKTITIGASQTPPPSPGTTPAPTPVPTPSEEPQQTEQIEFILIVVFMALVLGLALGLLIYLIKRK